MFEYVKINECFVKDVDLEAMPTAPLSVGEAGAPTEAYVTKYFSWHLVT